MGLEIRGPTKSIVIEEEDEKIFEMIDSFKLDAPECKKIWENFYQNPIISSAGQIQSFQNEICLLRDAYLGAKRQELIRKRNISTRNPQVAEQILASLLQGDRLLQTVEKIIDVCQDAVQNNVGLICLSD